MKNLETNEWEQVVRPRARAEVNIPINANSNSADKLWYAISDFEWLYTIEDVTERFANRFRVRVGGGYRLNSQLRFEFLYMIQLSRETITDKFETSDNILRFRIKYFLSKNQSTNLNGTGN